MGNLASGCGAVDMMVSLIGVNRGKIPPILNCDELDPGDGAGRRSRLATSDREPDLRDDEPDTQRPGGGPRDSRLPERNLARSLAHALARMGRAGAKCEESLYAARRGNRHGNGHSARA